MDMREPMELRSKVHGFDKAIAERKKALSMDYDESVEDIVKWRERADQYVAERGVNDAREVLMAKERKCLESSE